LSGRKRDDSTAELPKQWFLRDFAKAQSYLFTDSTFRRLSFETQGVWWALLLYSMRESAIPGWFLDKSTAAPMTEDEIVYAVAGSIDRLDAVRDGIAALKRCGPDKWLMFTPSDGFEIPKYAERYCLTVEAKKIRDANNVRQRRRREKLKAQAGDTLVDAGDRFKAGGAQ